MQPAVHEIEASTLLRKGKRIDSWFVSAYHLNLYRGCVFDCAYCDGRTDRYGVQGDYGSELSVKTNALELLARELDARRKRKPFRRGFVLMGGGVTDTYQPLEQRYQLTRGALEQLADHRSVDFPVHVLTKSVLVTRDVELLRRIDARARCVVSFSFSSVDEALSARFEPRAPSPRRRLQALSELKQAGLSCGAYLMPALPLLSDDETQLRRSLEALREAGADFVIFSTMTLKPGRQKEHYLSVLGQQAPELPARYRRIYPSGDSWGNAERRYSEQVNLRFAALARELGVAQRMPARLWTDLLDDTSRVIVTLEHLDHYLRGLSRASPFGQAARSIAADKRELSAERDLLGQPTAAGALIDDLQSLRGVGPATEQLIRELVETGRCALYDEVLAEANAA